MEEDITAKIRKIAIHRVFSIIRASYIRFPCLFEIPSRKELALRSTGGFTKALRNKTYLDDDFNKE